MSKECFEQSVDFIRELRKRFTDYVNILDNLRNDENPYVQRSVGNNLNDLYKYDPEKAL